MGSETRLWPMLPGAIRGAADWWRAHDDPNDRFSSKGEALDFCRAERNSDSVVHYPLGGRSANKPWLAEGVLMAVLPDAEARDEIPRLREYDRLHFLGGGEGPSPHPEYDAWRRMGELTACLRLEGLGEAELAAAYRRRIDAESALLMLCSGYPAVALCGGRGLIEKDRGQGNETKAPRGIPHNPKVESLALMARGNRSLPDAWVRDVADAIADRFQRDRPLHLDSYVNTQGLLDIIDAGPPLPGRIQVWLTEEGIFSFVNGKGWDTGSTEFCYARAYFFDPDDNPRRRFSWDDDETARWSWLASGNYRKRGEGKLGEAWMEGGGYVYAHRYHEQDWWDPWEQQWVDTPGYMAVPSGEVIYAVEVGGPNGSRWIAGDDNPGDPPDPPDPPGDQWSGRWCTEWGAMGNVRAHLEAIIDGDGNPANRAEQALIRLTHAWETRREC